MSAPLIELLNSWAELEPDRCRVEGKSHMVRLGRTEWPIWSQSEPDIGLLQYTLQQAIDSRAWTWELRRWKQTSCIAVVYPFVEGRHNINTTLFNNEAPTAVEALLLSYVKALDAIGAGKAQQCT